MVAHGSAEQHAGGGASPRPRRRPTRLASGDRRRGLRRATAVLCLVLAFACLVAAAATLSAQPAPGAASAARAGLSRPSLSPVVALSVVLFLLVVGALLRRERARPTPSAVRGLSPR